MYQRHAQQKRNQILQQFSAAERLEPPQQGKTTSALDQNNG
jgi:hypothetical protein